MSILQFSEDELAEKLRSINLEYRVAFAAACAERLFACYSLYAGLTKTDPKAKVRKALDYGWKYLTDGQYDPNVLDGHIDVVSELLPTDPWRPEMDAAEDAAAAVVFMLECLKDDSVQSACWAAGRAYAARDNYIASRMDGTNIDGDKILSNELVQSELSRQERDISQLISQSVSVAQLRERSQSESATFLPS